MSAPIKTIGMHKPFEMAAKALHQDWTPEKVHLLIEVVDAYASDLRARIAELEAAQPVAAGGDPEVAWESFKEWAEVHLGQGYSMESKECIYTDPVTRWAFNAWRGALKLKLAPSIPDGYVIVPKEATQEMVLASRFYDAPERATPEGIYRAMIAAAITPNPSRPAAGANEGVS